MVSSLSTELAADRAALLRHPVYGRVDSVESLQIFMSYHVFAVWDFMSVVKRLQRELTCMAPAWRPAPHPRLARFINEIVLDEESDRLPDGSVSSHFELYLRAMDEVGADSAPIRRFVQHLGQGDDPHGALAAAGVPTAAGAFVDETFGVVENGSLLEVAACFVHGREDVIPDMFRALLRAWPDAQSAAPHFVCYLDRHIELDGDQHGSLARELLACLSSSAEAAELEGATEAARRAIRSRIGLWDAAASHLGVPGTSPR